jgi:hypothetical protein
VGYSVAANTTTPSRTAASTVAGLSFVLTQAGVTFYTVTASAGTGGTISPSGSLSVNAGSNQTFSIKPKSGYTINLLKIDGVSVGRMRSYTLSDVTANHSIAVTFSRVAYQDR